MVSFEEAGKILDEAAASLPDEIFEKLNGGVNLLPARRTDSDGFLVMGTYNVGQMGRYIEIYYGSFQEAFPDATPEKARSELTKTLKHELTHHVENLAWDRSLERWDEQHKIELLRELYCKTMEAESILFVCWDNAGLSPIAEGLFKLASKKHCPKIRSASAGIAEGMPESVDDKAVKAAAAFGADISAHVPRLVTRNLLEKYDLVFCMTEEQGDTLAELFPEFDQKILCLGEKDITPPLFNNKGAWLRAADRLAAEINYLIDELCAEDKKDGN